MGHEVAIAAIEAGDVERGHALLADAVSATVDVELLNNLGVVTSVLGRLGEAEAILRTAAMLDGGREEVGENLAAARPGACVPASAAATRGCGSARSPACPTTAR